MMRRSLTVTAAALTLLILSPAPRAEEASAAAISSPAPRAQRAAQEKGLRAAYQKEFAYLEAEKHALQKRLRRAKAAARKAEGRAERETRRLAAQVNDLRAEADRLDETLRAAERESDPAEDAVDVLAETLDRARRTLAELGHALPAASAAADAEAAAKIDEESNASTDGGPAVATPPATPAHVTALADVAALAAGARAAILDGASIRREKGSFFEADGAAAEGDVLRVGRVASFGVGAAAAGALSPAGAGRLRLWVEDASTTARALVSGERPATLSLFIYDSLEKGIQPKADKTAREVVESGGVIAWVIVGLGAAAGLLVVLRVLILVVAGAGRRRLIRRLAPLVESGRADEALAAARGARGATARVLRRTLEGLAQAPDHLEDLVSEALLAEAPRIERFGTAITVFAAVAPLLGLLGTVTGMISTFDIITEHGTGDPKLLSGGISEALVTTELGLIVAIPTLLLGTLLGGRATALLRGLERAALRIANLAALATGGAPPAATERDSAEDDTVRERAAGDRKAADPDLGGDWVPAPEGAGA